MIKIEIKGIGIIELENDNDEYIYDNNAFNINDRTIELDIHFKNVDDEVIEKVNNVISQLEIILEISKKAILKDFEKKGEADYYINEWREEGFPALLTDEEFKQFISDTNPNHTIEKRLLSKLKIVRIGIHAHTESDFLTLDYAFNNDINSGFRDDLLVVRLNSKLELIHICNEG